MSDKESVGSFLKTSRLENAELIELVRRRPCLWDRACPEYRNRIEKDKAWAEIFRELEPTFEAMSRTDRHEFGMVVTRKWYNIRDSYKKYRNGTSRVNISGRPYIYAEYLTFLDAIYEPERARKRNYAFGKDAEEPDDPDDQEEWLNEVFVDMDTDAPDPMAGPAKKIKTEFPRAKESAEQDDSIVSVLVNLIEKEEDEDRAFFKSITPTVKSLTDEDKFLFRIQVMKLLNALKKRSRRHPSMKRERVSQESETE